MNILIVDDKRDNLHLLEILLKGSGYEVVSAANGAEALEKLRAERFDVIISDILMPVMDGFQLCREVRGDKELKGIPFVFYTATYTDGKDEDFALKLGADRYVRKPVEPDELIEIVQGVLKDAERGKIARKEPLLEEEEVFKLYNQRLVAKLERKMLALEEEMTERKLAEERAVHLNDVLRAIRSVNQLIVKEKDRDRLLKEACKNLVTTPGYYNAWIALVDESGKLVTTAEAALGKEFLPLVERLESGRLPNCAGRALSEPGVLTIEDPPSTCVDCPLAGMYAERAGMTCRLESAGSIYGLLTVSVAPGCAADEEERSLFSEVAGDIAFALWSMELARGRNQAEQQLEQTLGDLRKTLGGIIQAVAMMVETRDPYTAGHQRRVADLARATATEMELSKEMIEGIRMAGVIHDLGKISVPAEILTKPTRLTEMEFNIIKTHPQVGYDVLKNIKFPWPIAEIVLQHHERMDGSGYPQGISGEEILLEARIMGVADVVEAMASHRPYRPALGIDKALEEISENKGVFYDPRAVEACLTLFTEKGFELA